MSALICGSLAFDHIMVFHDRFKNHILPDKVHILNVSFLVPDMRREFGGCAGNIAYNLALLGGQGFPMATVGRDFAPYASWLEQCGIEQRYVRTLEDAYTAQAFITTDLDDNQITAFHPGAMNFSHLNDVPEADGISIGTVSPDGREGMLKHARRFVAAGIPFIFDPGQGLPLFSGEELVEFLDQATWVALNDYEWALLQERTGLAPEAVMAKVRALIVTRGGNGSSIYVNGDCLQIPTVTARFERDPTGCGDAYRAGILYGLMHDMPWEITGRIASLIGAIKMEHYGTQNHCFERTEFEARFVESFGYSFS